MKRLGLKRHVARVKPILTAQHRKDRLAWAAKYKDFDNWPLVIFMDEAKMWIGGSTVEWVTRADGDAFNPACVIPAAKKGEGVMVWAAIWLGGRTELVRFDLSIVKKPLLEEWKKVVQLWRGYGTPYILQDNVPLHWTPPIRAFLKKHKFQYIDHPASSPDLNPIENCRAIVKRRLKLLPERPTNLDELFEAANKLWMEIPQEKIDACIESMEARRKAVEKAHGFGTKY
ncbi:hypothetical protein TREMEDRAFT_65640 [Tremella mesenterica DSM 1558]|uniref:uncharacterized protein n=1 Tax=Tremella mesenterica (strain ATCC 24925 / CBS 8224 / DSM 1558 / NBRC 9311 / NRRL Y-6157 / RJB 2259-6 / UBC 559-6) TaxID=578456 RepID=UPI00032CA90B|nr:uncharacterized protein TREMEDRAFT_65640 [Tremella mesenterica DSM 1558]EIW66362.1 hypothetical protein TREMEDRAFT_65640 [Tremella mesenterica DSM 1558]